MKIVFFDHVRKFTSDIIENCERQGNQVKIDRYLDPALVHECDVSFFEFCDISIQRASDPNDSFWKENPQPMGKNIVVRAHDIDLHTSNYRGVNWNWVNHLIFVSPFMKQHFLPQMDIPDSVQVHMIPHGVNPDRFSFRDKPKGNKIAWIGNINWAKNLPLALQVLAENPEYELHVVGSSLDRWEKVYVDNFVKRNNLKFFHQDSVENVNDFLQDKDFILLTSMKEAFSFIIAEGCLIGLKPLIHWFPGAEMIWKKEWLWNKSSEVKGMLEGDYHPQEYRDYILENYPIDKMLKSYDEIIKTTSG